MEKELLYTKTTSNEHIKRLGQYFTNFDVADFMVKWACESADNMLDPSVGNSVFLKSAKKMYPSCDLSGYEIDKNIIGFFGNPANAKLFVEDYMLNGWSERYDAIVCNPPYNRFQNISNRDEILEKIFEYTGIKHSASTNLYILFLLKSIYQLSESGRLAYIIPTEFLNSKYGDGIKKILIEKRILRAIINFKNNDKMFFNATTTSCILLIDKEAKDYVSFYNLEDIEDLNEIQTASDLCTPLCVEYDKLRPQDKWRKFLNREEHKEYRNLKTVSDFCHVARGIATGANAFFCLSESKIKEYSIPEKYYTPCICRSADVKNPIFTSAEFENLSKADKNVYLLDIPNSEAYEIKDYIKLGEQQGCNKGFLTSGRKPWFSMEKKPISPIWVSSASRNSMKFVRNLAGAKNLTTFHSLYIKNEYAAETDLIFCYFLTPIAQTILKIDRRELGGGLNKFQPNDLNGAKMIDIGAISSADKEAVITIYNEMKICYSDEQVQQLNDIFIRYIL